MKSFKEFFNDLLSELNEKVSSEVKQQRKAMAKSKQDTEVKPMSDIVKVRSKVNKNVDGYGYGSVTRYRMDRLRNPGAKSVLSKSDKDRVDLFRASKNSRKRFGPTTSVRDNAKSVDRIIAANRNKK